MPLLLCPVCRNEVADDALACTKCGSPSVKIQSDNKARKNRYLVGGGVFVIFLLIGVVYIWSTPGLFPRNELPKGPGASQKRR